MSTPIFWFLLYTRTCPIEQSRRMDRSKFQLPPTNFSGQGRGDLIESELRFVVDPPIKAKPCSMPR